MAPELVVRVVQDDGAGFGVAFGFDMDDGFNIAKLASQRQFDPVANIMRRGDSYSTLTCSGYCAVDRIEGLALDAVAGVINASI